MASGPITSWQIDREKVETLTHFTSLGSQIAADSDCSHKIKRHWFLGRKAMMHLGSILKSRDITLTAEGEEELRRILINMKEESEKAGLKFNVQKTKITASGSNTSW